MSKSPPLTKEMIEDLILDMINQEVVIYDQDQKRFYFNDLYMDIIFDPEDKV